MRNPERIPNVLLKVQTLWELNPDMRLIQLLEWVGSQGITDTFYLEDDKLEVLLDRLIDEHE